MNNPKSAMTAGVLGILLGAFGAHEWYLGNVPQAKKYVRLSVIGVILLALAIALRAAAPSIGQLVVSHVLTSIAAICNVFGWLTILVSAVWGIISGVLLLVGGDQALIAQGYVVPAMTARDANGNPVSVVPTAGNAVQAVPTLPTVQAQVQSQGQPLIQSQGQAPGQTSISASAPGLAPTQPPTPTQPVATPGQTQIQTPAQAPATVSHHIDLPPAPTLAEQASDTAQPQPIVFHASDIPAQAAPAFPHDPATPITTQNIARPGLTVDASRAPSGRFPAWIRYAVIAVIILAAVGILATMIKGGIDSTLAAAYQEAYRAARDLQPEIKSAHDSSSCAYVAEYAQAASVDRSTYNGYINTCEKLLTGTRSLVDALGATSIVRTDEAIAADYAAFVTSYDSVFVDADTAAEISATFVLYRVWHSYLVAVDRLGPTSPELDFQQAADLLRTSGNQTLATYGEEWYLREIAFLADSRAYQEMSYTDPAKEQARLDLDQAYAELTDWIADHRPDITKLAPYTAPDTTAMYQNFTKLYDAIRAGYEAHYNYDSNDCAVAGDKVYCS